MNTQGSNQNNPLSLEGREKTLKSPKMIGEHLNITSVPTYLVTIVIMLLICAFLVWGIWGKVSYKTHYHGLIFPEHGMSEISLPNKGEVSKMMVHNGDYVKIGDPVAVVSMGQSHSVLTSTVEGAVTYTMTENHQFDPFEPIIGVFAQHDMDEVNERNFVIAYTDYAGQRDMQVGMGAQVWPDNEKREEIGYVRGTIMDIDRYPSDFYQIKYLVKNEEMAKKFFDSSELVYRVKIRLQTDPEDPTRLNWSFGKPEGVLMDVGTYCAVMTETERMSLFEYLFRYAVLQFHKLKLMLE